MQDGNLNCLDCMHNCENERLEHVCNEIMNISDYVLPLLLILGSICVGRVFCKKGCDSDGETWDECKSYSDSSTLSFSLLGWL